MGEQNNFLLAVTDQTATIGFNKAFTKFLGKGITLSWAGCFEVGPHHLLGDKSEIDAHIEKTTQRQKIFDFVFWILLSVLADYTK